MASAQAVESIATAEACACERKPFISVREAADLLGRSREYLYAGLRERRFPGAQFGRAWEMPRAFVTGFIAEVDAGSTVCFEDFAAAWIAKAGPQVAA
ncbi:excisionase family DNA-binding protein [Nonomuraea sp. NPDC050202]|uniref:excisionase family DNA-binding protein n=1 Tax=Nonomuraea sp. NPDC050202 TaxID=3155035 RepID=UPI0033ED88E3